MKNIAPGEYKVHAWEDVEPTAWLDPEFMKNFENKGSALTLAEGGQANVQVSVVPSDPQ